MFPNEWETRKGHSNEWILKEDKHNSQPLTVYIHSFNSAVDYSNKDGYQATLGEFAGRHYFIKPIRATLNQALNDCLKFMSRFKTSETLKRFFEQKDDKVYQYVKSKMNLKLRFYHCMKCHKEMDYNKPICVNCFLDSINFVQQLAPYYQKAEKKYNAFFQKYYFSKIHRKPIEKISDITFMHYWFTYIAVIETKNGTFLLCANRKPTPLFKIEWHI